MPDSTDLIGSKEACGILDVDKSTLTRWAADGVLVPVYKLPGRNGPFVFNRADVERLADQRAEASA